MGRIHITLFKLHLKINLLQNILISTWEGCQFIVVREEYNTPSVPFFQPSELRCQEPIFSSLSQTIFRFRPTPIIAIDLDRLQ